MINIEMNKNIYLILFLLLNIKVSAQRYILSTIKAKQTFQFMLLIMKVKQI